MRSALTIDLILALLLLLFAVLLNHYQWMHRWDNIIYDLASSEISRELDDNIVIVAIDEPSLINIGRWPWPRDVHANMINYLHHAGVSAIGLDLIFMEPDTINPENDRLLGQAIRRFGRVVLPVLTQERDGQMVVIKPLQEIARAATLAHVNLNFDTQGIVRKLDLSIRSMEGENLPAMSVALARLEHKPVIARNNTVLIPFAGPPDHYPRLSYVDVLHDETLRNSLQGKVVIIGVTAAGLTNEIATPVSTGQRLMTGVEFQANATAAMSSRLLIHRIAGPVYHLHMLVLLVIPVMLYHVVQPLKALLLSFMFVLITLVLSFLYLKYLMLWLAPMPAIVSLLFSYPLWSLRRIEVLVQTLFQEHEQASVTLRSIGDAVVTIDAQGRIKYMNPAAEKIFACSLADARKKPFAEICWFVENNAAILGGKTLNSGEMQKDSMIIHNSREEEFAVNVTANPVHNKKGEKTGVVYALSDVTELHKMNREMAYIATHDVLTRLLNRVLLQDRLQQALSSASREKANFAVLFIDLDGFKKINDGMGHNCGDYLLQEVAKRLSNWVRHSDTIARWGGDEFVILLNNLTHPTDANEVAGKIIHSISQPYHIRNQEVFVSASIGISLFPKDGRNSEVLLAKADKAMYSIKRNQHNNFCFYSQDLETQSKEKLVLETELHQALQNNEFEVFYQPQINLNNGKLIGSEALIRWRHPKKGLLAPDNFISLLEEIGLIVPIGVWVIKDVCEQLKCWQEQGLPLLKVAVNLSAKQFIQKDLVSFISRQFASCAIDPEFLQVEITESIMIQDVKRVAHILDELKSAGISIAVDDFGTGYSSLEYLKQFPIDKLKIDKSYVSNVLNDADDASIVQAVIALGHSLNLQVIAEGVENEAQMQFLKSRHCDYGQGYYFSKPINCEQMGLLIREYQNKSKI